MTVRSNDDWIWIRIPLVVAGVAMLGLGVAEFVERPSLDAAVRAGFGFAALLLVRLDSRFGPKASRRAAGSFVAIFALWAIADSLRSEVADPSTYGWLTWWILGIAAGVVLLVFATYWLLALRGRNSRSAEIRSD
jgi:hypothetical protein